MENIRDEIGNKIEDKVYIITCGIINPIHDNIVFEIRGRIWRSLANNIKNNIETNMFKGYKKQI